MGESCDDMFAIGTCVAVIEVCMGVMVAEIRTSSISFGKMGVIEGTFTKHRRLMQCTGDIVW